MSIVKFCGYKVSKCDFVNTCQNGENIELNQTFSYNVKYDSTDVCIGEYEIGVSDKKNPNQFHINILISGIFKYDKNEKRESIHIQSYKELFPFARSFVATLTTAAGIPPLYINAIDIENQPVYRIEKNI